jgi:cob(I)alamin adenosyltransferase
MKKGLMHIYSGEGKGKTTAAIGLGVRAIGRGYKVLLVQFLKGVESGEIKALKTMKLGFEILKSESPIKFVCDMNKDEFEEAGRLQRRILEEAKKRISQGGIDLLILDEVLGAVENGMINIQDIVELAKNRPEGMELVLTGRVAPKELAELADYQSDIRCVKHPMNSGIKSRKGIEE